MLYITNAFSLNMLTSGQHLLAVEQVPTALVVRLMSTFDWKSCVGHESTAVLISSLTGFDVQCQRISLSLDKNDLLLVAQYAGPRLPEGATSLPEFAELKWFIVHVEA